MKSGFYDLQENFSGDMRGFLDSLDSIEAELSINISLEPGVFEPAVVGVGSFMQGYCGHLALRMADTYGLDIYAIQANGELTHIFNTFHSPDGNLCYLDARGVTDDVSLFVEPFRADTFSIIGPMTRREAEDRMNAEGWAFVEDEISNAMVDWLTSKFAKNFAPAIDSYDSVVRKPSLDDMMARASARMKQLSRQEMDALAKQISFNDPER